MQKKRGLLKVFAIMLSLCIFGSSLMISKKDVLADGCGGMRDEDLYTTPSSVIKDTGLHWAIRSCLGAAREKNVDLTTALIGSSSVYNIDHELGAHYEDMESWTNQWWIEDMEGIQYATSASTIRISYMANKEKSSGNFVKLNNIGKIGALTGLSALKLKKDNLDNVTGLGTLVNLEELDLSENNITDVSELSNLTKLKKLTLSHNNIANIGIIENFSNLTYLELGYNNISSLPDMSKLTKVTGLDLSHNSLTNIQKLSSMTGLRGLDLRGNKDITDYTSLASLINLEETLTYLDDSDAKSDLFAAIEVNKLLNKFNISKMKASDLDAVNQALDTYYDYFGFGYGTHPNISNYIDTSRIEAADNNYTEVVAGRAPHYYPEYDFGGEPEPVLDKLQIKAVDIFGEPVANVVFSRRGGYTLAADGTKFTTGSNGIVDIPFPSTNPITGTNVSVYDDIYEALDDEIINFTFTNDRLDKINDIKATGFENLTVTVIKKDVRAALSELDSAIKEAEKEKDTYKYTIDSYTAFSKALQEAKAEMNNRAMTASSLGEKANALKRAKTNLTLSDLCTTLKIKVVDNNNNPFVRPFEVEVSLSTEFDNYWKLGRTDTTDSSIYLPAKSFWKGTERWEIRPSVNGECFDPVQTVFAQTAKRGNQIYFSKVTVGGVEVDTSKEITLKVKSTASGHANKSEEELKPDGSLLWDYIAKANTYNSRLYDSQDYKALTTAISNAQSVISQAEQKKADRSTYASTQISLNDAGAKLLSAMKKLDESKGSGSDDGGDTSGKVLSDGKVFRAKVVDETGSPVNGVIFNIENEEEWIYYYPTSVNGIIEYTFNKNVDYGLDFNCYLKPDQDAGNNKVWKCTQPSSPVIITTNGSSEVDTIDGYSISNRGEVIFVITKSGGNGSSGGDEGGDAGDGSGGDEDGDEGGGSGGDEGGEDSDNDEPAFTEPVYSDENTFRAKVIDSKGRKVSGVSFRFEQPEEYAFAPPIDISCQDGILEYAIGYEGRDDEYIDYSVSLSADQIYDGSRKWNCSVTNSFSTDFKASFFENPKIIYVNGTPLADMPEAIFTLSPDPANKEALNNAISSALLVDKTQYISDSVKNLESALSKAQKMVGDEYVLQAEIDEATANLEKAIAGLEKIVANEISKDSGVYEEVKNTIIEGLKDLFEKAEDIIIFVFRVEIVDSLGNGASSSKVGRITMDIPKDFSKDIEVYKVNVSEDNLKLYLSSGQEEIAIKTNNGKYTKVNHTIEDNKVVIDKATSGVYTMVDMKNKKDASPNNNNNNATPNNNNISSNSVTDSVKKSPNTQDRDLYVLYAIMVCALLVYLNKEKNTNR